MADTDKNGKIDAWELMRALQILGMPPENFQLALQTLHRYDKNRDGNLQLAEYRVLAREALRQLQDADESFTKWDVNGDQRIDSNELYNALSAVGLADSHEHAQAVMQKFSVEQSPSGTLDRRKFREVVEEMRSFQTHKSLFRRYDADGNGHINSSELHGALEELGLAGLHDRSHVEAIMRRMDSDGNGTLELAEFVRLSRAIPAFRQFDTDANGSIDKDELAYALHALGLRTGSSSEIIELLRRFDSDGDGSLQLDEYVQLVEELQGHGKATRQPVASNYQHEMAHQPELHPYQAAQPHPQAYQQYHQKDLHQPVYHQPLPQREYQQPVYHQPLPQKDYQQPVSHQKVPLGTVLHEPAMFSQHATLAPPANQLSV
uniref:EF-hand domain-containing protein n=1 Tax=Haptolina brevifila TaxID=156173 RepID=A0A7S2NEZ8_9EUKA